MAIIPQLKVIRLLSTSLQATPRFDAHHPSGKLACSHNRKETGDEVQGVADIPRHDRITQPGIANRRRHRRTERGDEGEDEHHGGGGERDARTPLGEVVVQNRVHGAPTGEQREEGLAEEAVEAAVEVTVAATVFSRLEAPRCGEGACASGHEDCEQEPENGNVEEAGDLLALKFWHRVFPRHLNLHVS